MQPTVFFGVICAVAGAFSTLAGGLAGDALRGRLPGSYFTVSGEGMLVSVPCFLLFLVIPFPLAWVFVFLTVFFLFFNTGPTNAILANVTHPSIRATGFAVNILVIHLFGDAISPPVIGSIADHVNRHEVVRLVGVEEGGPAAKAGLKAGDAIVEVGDGELYRVRLASDLDRFTAQRHPGDEIRIRYLRGDEDRTATAVLEAADQQSVDDRPQGAAMEHPPATLGVSVEIVPPASISALSWFRCLPHLVVPFGFGVLATWNAIRPPHPIDWGDRSRGLPLRRQAARIPYAVSPLAVARIEW